MSGLDIIQVPGQPGMFARRVAVEAWQRAGSPKLRDAGRLYGEQKYLWDGYASGKPGFYPADNPDEPWRDLSHVRFVAFDIWSDYAYWRPKMLAAGFVELSYEPWHFYLPNPKQYAIVTSIPSSATDGSTAFQIPEKDTNPMANMTPAEMGKFMNDFLNWPAFTSYPDGTPHPAPPSISQAFQSLDVVYHALLSGGPALDDEAKPIDRSIAEIQVKLDAIAAKQAESPKG